MKVMLVVTHLLGTGHLSRALTLGRAFVQAGHQVMVASGGMPAPHLDSSGIDLLQLPPLRSDGTNFTRLLGDNGDVVDDAYLASRVTALTDALHRFAPDVLITELFPFGRRSLAAEFTALLEAAQAMTPRPVVLSSIRDILAPPSKPAKAEKADAIIDAFYDAVLVHSDPATTTLDQSWPVSDMLGDRLRYTGYVAPAPAGPHPDRAGDGEILVSAGGGNVGDALYHAAIGTARLMPDQQFLLLVGGAETRLQELRAQAPENVTLSPPRPDFRQMLNHASALISMCGYNTTMDILQSGVPSVLIPFDDGKEVEQTLRARALAQLNGISVLPSTDMTPQTLMAALNATIGQSRDLEARFDGATEAVAIATDLTKVRT